jgi:hypothetical protein
MWWGDMETGHAFSCALVQRDGPIIPLIVDSPDRAHIFHERHLCIDTTAAGGNAALLIDQTTRSIIRDKAALFANIGPEAAGGCCQTNALKHRQTNEPIASKRP